MCNLPSKRLESKFTVTSDLPKVTRFVIENPDPEPGVPRKYITNSAYNAWVKFQHGCKAYVIKEGQQVEIEFRMLMLLGVRDARKMVPAIYSWDKPADIGSAGFAYVYNQE